MSHILDTHTLLWFVENDVRLSASAKATIETTQESLYVSTVSLWEIAIKVNIGKLNISSSLETLISYLQEQEFTFLSIHNKHIQAYISCKSNLVSAYTLDFSVNR